MCLVDFKLSYWGQGPPGHDRARRPKINILLFASICFCIFLHTCTFYLSKTCSCAVTVFTIVDSFLKPFLRHALAILATCSQPFHAHFYLLHGKTNKCQKPCFFFIFFLNIRTFFHTCTFYLGKTHKSAATVFTILTEKLNVKKLKYRTLQGLTLEQRLSILSAFWLV